MRELTQRRRERELSLGPATWTVADSAAYSSLLLWVS
jgi:hypothetical protein